MKHPNLKGIKNSSSNMWLRRELLLLREEKGFRTLFFEGQGMGGGRGVDRGL